MDTDPIRYDLSKRESSSSIGRKYGDWINEKRVAKALGSINSKKSPGPDGLKPLVFEHFPPNIISLLVFVYKASIALNFTAGVWKKARVVFLPKPGKPDYTTPKAYRPISLTNYLLKTLEKLCCWKTKEDLEASPLHERQHGFRSDLSLIHI